MKTGWRTSHMPSLCWTPFPKHGPCQVRTAPYPLKCWQTIPMNRYRCRATAARENNHRRVHRPIRRLRNNSVPAYDTERPRVHYLNNEEIRMNRRTTLKFLMTATFISAPRSSQAEENWVILHKRILRPNIRSISFDIRKARGMAKLGIELRGNSIWLYDLNFVGSEDSRRLPVNLNIPLSAASHA